MMEAEWDFGENPEEDAHHKPQGAHSQISSINKTS